MKNLTSFIWRDKDFRGIKVKTIRVRIFDRKRNSKVDIYPSNLIEHDGVESLRGDKISNFSYVLTSTGIQIRNDYVYHTEKPYVYICLFITPDFDPKVLNKITCPEMKYVKEALKRYYEKQKTLSETEVKELKTYIQDDMPNEGETVFEELIEAINDVNFVQLENLTRDLSWQQKAVIWEKTAKIIATKN